jgi:hypothetical protein
MERLLTYQPKDEEAWERGILRIFFDDLPTSSNSRHLLFMNSPVKHPLEGMARKN